MTYPPGMENSVRQFYGEVLGLDEVPGVHPGGAIWFAIAGTEIHFGEGEAVGALSRRHVAFEIENPGEAKAYLESRGVEMSFSTRIEGRDRFFVRDPFGNRLEFLSYEPGSDR